ncbi:hypothetical protein SCP_0800800 [Sparassis crispa]|uniref:Uncharacterized protein n=1 Tax=Sparassis crispa TaxID=139825 RepID=A0A401GTQ9_9APHY|nr:hypothetical protein SCP_0800800 [Sparassis crispa]GBE85563.1 hypothetical protein SCP_0800800 [Sparassis crispa]
MPGNWWEDAQLSPRANSTALDCTTSDRSASNERWIGSRQSKLDECSKPSLYVEACICDGDVCKVTPDARPPLDTHPPLDAHPSQHTPTSHRLAMCYKYEHFYKCGAPSPPRKPKYFECSLVQRVSGRIVRCADPFTMRYTVDRWCGVCCLKRPKDRRKGQAGFPTCDEARPASPALLLSPHSLSRKPSGLSPSGSSLVMAPTTCPTAER